MQTPSAALRNRTCSQVCRGVGCSCLVPVCETSALAHDVLSPAAPKQQPDFRPSGKLFAEENKVDGVTLKYAEPEESRLPSERWRMYVFKGDKEVTGEPVYDSTPASHSRCRQSPCICIGKPCICSGASRRCACSQAVCAAADSDGQVVDVHLLHPSVSSQHAVLQYRQIESLGEDGMPVLNIKWVLHNTLSQCILSPGPLSQTLHHRFGKYEWYTAQRQED